MTEGKYQIDQVSCHKWTVVSANTYPHTRHYGFVEENQFTLLFVATNPEGAILGDAETFQEAFRHFGDS